MTTTMLNLNQIRTHGGTQSRAGLHVETITEYADAMRDGDTFPPVDVYHDGESYWLADGFHRVEAAYKAGLTRLSANVHQGTRRDAVLASVGANARHGLRRTNEDKRRAVQTLLNDDEWGQWSDREIARRAGVSAPFVATIRAQLAGSATVNVYSQPQRTGADGRVINTANIGRPATTSRMTLPDISTIGVGDTILTLSGTTGTVRRVFEDHVLADFDKGGELVEEEWSLNHLRIILKAEDAPAVVEPESAPTETTPSPDFNVGDWVRTKWGTRGVVRSIDENGIGIICYPAKEPQYILVEDAAGSLTRRANKCEFKVGQRAHLYYEVEVLSGEVIGIKWSNKSEGPLEGHAIVRWGDGIEDEVPFYALDLVDEQPNGTVPTPAVPLDHPAHQLAQPAASTPSHDFQVGDWVITKWDGYGIVRSVDEKGICFEDSYGRMKAYTFDEATRKLTKRTKREFRTGDRAVIASPVGYLVEVIGTEWSDKSGGPLEWHAIVRYPHDLEIMKPFWQLELTEQPDLPADEDDADDPLDRDLYNLDLTPAGFKAGEALRLEDGQIGVIVPVDDAAGLLTKGALLTVETPQEAPAAEPFDLPETIRHMPPLPWKMNGDTYIVSAENPMLTAARVYDSKVGQLIVEAMNERYAAFARQDNDDIQVGEQIYYLSAGDNWRLATVTGLSAKRVQIKLPDKTKPSYVELRSLDRRPFGLPLLPAPAPRKGEYLESSEESEVE